ncbi:MAG: hypothetical protein RJA63_722 [Pseudomonadota bacterium]|jgi:hypothetical protein|nr:type II secretion system protein GspG [Uliginosibacterium sp.]
MSKIVAPPKSKVSMKWSLWVLSILTGVALMWIEFYPIESNQRVHGTKRALIEIGQAIDLFSRDKQRPPFALDELKNFGPETTQSGYLVHQALLEDKWDRPFVYKPVQNGVHPYLLYSVGSNGIDENGDGDDINRW